MKKIVATILSFLYLMLISGASINLHYCGDRLESVNLNNNADFCCCGVGEINSNCCQNEVFTLEIDIDQLTIAHQNLVAKQIYFSNIIQFGFIDTYIENIQETKIEKYEIPPPKPEEIWLLNCTFTFYG